MDRRKTPSHLTLRLTALLLVLLLACTSGAPPQGAPSPAMSADSLVVIESSAIDSMDAHVANRNDARIIIARINQSLVTRDPQTMQPAPLLATSWRAVDPTTWEFKLRPGVKFTNGEAFTAQTVKFNFERIAKPELKSFLATSVTPLLAGVDVVDPLTVRIRTKNPYPLLLERLSIFWIVPEAYVRERGDQGFADRPIGTGPYKFVEWVQGQHVKIERNPDYWGESATFREVTYRQIMEGTTALAELFAGTAHIVLNVAPDQVAAVKTSGVADILAKPGVNTLELRTDSIPRGDPNPFQDKRVRHALSYAIDKEAIAKNLLGGYSQVVATNIGPQLFGHDPSVKPYPYDPAKARQLLADAGYPNGFTVRFLWYPVSDFRNVKEIVEAIAGDLAKVGIRTNLFSVGATEISQYTNPGKAGPLYIGNNGNAELFDGGFGFSYLRKSSVLAYYWSDELERLIVRQETTVDQEERKRVLSQIQHLLREEAPYAWGWSGHRLDAISNKIDLREGRVGNDLAVERIRPK
jgi:peptide/nickel transport system substrate-binding protein